MTSDISGVDPEANLTSGSVNLNSCNFYVENVKSKFHAMKILISDVDLCAMACSKSQKSELRMHKSKMSELKNLVNSTVEILAIW